MTGSNSFAIGSTVKDTLFDRISDVQRLEHFFEVFLRFRFKGYRPQLHGIQSKKQIDIVLDKPPHFLKGGHDVYMHFRGSGAFKNAHKAGNNFFTNQFAGFDFRFRQVHHGSSPVGATLCGCPIVGCPIRNTAGFSLSVSHCIGLLSMYSRMRVRERSSRMMCS